MNDGHNSDIALIPAALAAVISWSAATPPVNDGDREQHGRRNGIGQQTGNEIRKDLEHLRGAQIVFGHLPEGSHENEEHGQHADDENKDPDQLGQDVLLEQPHSSANS